MLARRLVSITRFRTLCLLVLPQTAAFIADPGGMLESEIERMYEHMGAAIAAVRVRSNVVLRQVFDDFNGN